MKENFKSYPPNQKSLKLILISGEIKDRSGEKFPNVNHDFNKN